MDLAHGILLLECIEKHRRLADEQQATAKQRLNTATGFLSAAATAKDKAKADFDKEDKIFQELVRLQASTPDVLQRLESNEAGTYRLHCSHVARLIRQIYFQGSSIIGGPCVILLA